MVSRNAGRARRGRRFSFPAALGIALALAVPAGAGAQPDVHLTQIRYRELVGTWSCTGTDAAGAPIATTLQWGFNDGASAGGDFYFLDQPRHPSAALPVISETWFFDTAGGANVWRSTPDPGAADPASWTSAGMSNGKLTFIRQAPASTASRTFELTGPNRLTLRQLVAPGRPAFALRCTRTVTDAPR